jgi:hypothetical protein
MVDGLAKRMEESIKGGDWNATDKYLNEMFEVFGHAKTDCHAGPAPDQCKQDAESLDKDVHKIFDSVHAKNQEATEAELKYMIMELPKFEAACHLEGQCKLDMEHIQRVAEWALNQTEAGDWNHTEMALHRMVEVFEEAKKDCSDHPTPPSPEECHKAEWVMEDTLQGLVGSAGDKYQEGVLHFSAELEHRTFWIERACNLHDQCKSDWDRIGHIAHGIYDECKRGDWMATDAAVVEVVAIVKNDIHQDCEHNSENRVFRTNNVLQCAKDIQGVVKAAEDIIANAKSGSPDIATILKDAETIANDVKAAENDCKFSNAPNKPLKDLPSCMNDVQDIVVNAKDILQQIQSGKPNFSTLLTDVQNIMGDVTKAKSDCNMKSPLKTRNVQSCLTDVKEIATAAMDIVSQAKSGKPNFAQMLQDVQTIYGDAQHMQTDCKFAREFRFPHFQNAQCKMDMATLAKEAFIVLKDVTAHKWAGILKELPTMVKTIKKAEADCQ